MTSEPKMTRSPLEPLAAVVLVASLVAVAWIVAVALWPEWLRLPSLQTEVVAVLAVLSAALGLTSAVALRQTR